jgi:hypothetical protein
MDSLCATCPFVPADIYSASDWCVFCGVCVGFRFKSQLNPGVVGAQILVRHLFKLAVRKRNVCASVKLPVTACGGSEAIRRYQFYKVRFIFECGLNVCFALDFPYCFGVWGTVQITSDSFQVLNFDLGLVRPEDEKSRHEL